MILGMPENIWPKGIRCAAVLTFDNDDESGLIDAFGPDKMFYVSQGYYDTNEGTWRVLRILERQNVKATFCMVGKTAEKRPDIVRAIVEKGHEIASHGWDHRPYYNMDPGAEKEDIQKTVEYHQENYGEHRRGSQDPRLASQSRHCQKSQ